ncbi:MAG: PAS domain-containing protein [Gammaproteobacteria bacterium]|nr:PAS domain-containing protein [Gammaproteobacteria bacterium]
MAVERLFASFAALHDPTDLLDALATGVVLLDATGRVLHANVAAQGLLGAGLNQARGRMLAELLVDSAPLQALLQRARERGEVFAEGDIALRTVASPRDARSVDATVTPIEDVTGSRRLLLELVDATPRARISRENELRARLEGSRMMTRQLAHEIKNPLGGVRGAAQLLERQLPDPALREYTGVIINEADRLTALVDGMLGPARAPQKSQLNIHEICEHVFRLLQAEARPDVTLERDYDPSVPEGEFDRNQLVQALLNLARNALQAVGQGAGDRGRIVLRTRAVANVHIGLARHRLAVRVDVVDDGPGVPDGIRGSLFYPLVTGRANGTGLGLAVAQEIVTRNGGSIEFESEPGRTVFSLMLPLAAGEARPADGKEAPR